MFLHVTVVSFLVAQYHADDCKRRDAADAIP
jgi:hypothetical protein